MFWWFPEVAFLRYRSIIPAFTVKWLVSLKTRLACPCGEMIRGDDEDDLVEKAFAHLREKHPTMADEYEREHILFMAY